MEHTKARIKARNISIIGLIVVAGLIAYYVYLLRIGEAQRIMNSIRNFGYAGIAIGIVLQAVVNMLPVPGEFTTIVLMEIYGPVWGGVFSWIGGIVGAVGGLYLSRWLAKPFFSKLVQPYLSKVEEWLERHETMGLLIMRFVPFVPYHLVNYAAGLLRVKLWGFVWTTALGILPYTIAVSGLYAGLRRGSLWWGIAGGVIFLAIAAISWYVKQRDKRRSPSTS